MEGIVSLCGTALPPVTYVYAYICSQATVSLTWTSIKNLSGFDSGLRREEVTSDFGSDGAFPRLLLFYPVMATNNSRFSLNMADTETINEIPNLNPSSLPVLESERTLAAAAVSEIPVLALSSYCSHHTNTVYICQYDKYLIIIFQGNRGGHVDGGGSNK